MNFGQWRDILEKLILRKFKILNYLAISSGDSRSLNQGRFLFYCPRLDIPELPVKKGLPRMQGGSAVL